MYRLLAEDYPTTTFSTVANIPHETNNCVMVGSPETTQYIVDMLTITAVSTENILMLLENALRYKMYRENGFLVENATERYLHFKKLYPELSGRIPLKHIATYLGIAPESLSRIRSALKEENKHEQ